MLRKLRRTSGKEGMENPNESAGPPFAARSGMARLVTPIVHALLGAILVIAFVAVLRAEYVTEGFPLDRLAGFAVAGAAWAAGWMLLVAEELAKLRRRALDAGESRAPTAALLGLDEMRLFGVAVCVYGVAALVAASLG
jgi:hypothetical protein